MTRTVLAPLTSLGIGGPAEVIDLESPADWPSVVEQARTSGGQVVSFGAGSNVLIADDGVAVPVVRMLTSGVEVRRAGRDSRLLTVEAGHSLARLHAFTVAEGMVGMETLAGIPGTVGAMPVQNVGAYGQDTAGTLVAVQAWDWWRDRPVTLPASRLRLGYRSSLFKHTSRWTILRASFILRRSRLSAPVHYREVADFLDTSVGRRVTVPDLVAAVLEIRRRKGMVLESFGSAAGSAGSVFVTPELTPRQAVALRRRGATVHRLRQDGSLRVGPGWLLPAAGFQLGETVGEKVRISAEHYTLVAEPGATAITFATAIRTLRDRVQSATGVTMRPELDLLGDLSSYADMLQGVPAR